MTDFYSIVASRFKGMLLLGQFVMDVITIVTAITQLDIEGEGSSLY